MPAPQGGGMIKAAWFRTYTANERPALFDRIVQSWDTANKATELSDFSVCTSWGIAGKDLYLLHVLRRRMEFPELKRAVLEQAAAFNANVVLIEDKASGTQLIQELVELGLHAVTRYQPQSDKIMRSRSCRTATPVASGEALLRREHARPDRNDRERLCPPAQGDRLACGIPARADGLPGRQIRRPGRLDRPAARLAQAGRPRARRHLPILQGARPSAAHRPAGAAIGDGQEAGPPPVVSRREPDGTVEVSEADAQPLLRAGWLRADAGGL